ncbi:MAG: PilZ domain-containing protein [Nitrospiraceae bacterium]
MKQECPRCETDFVQLIRPDGFLDRLAGLMFIYPIRCQLCTHRFRVFLPGVASPRQKVDRRQYVRFSARFPVTFSGDSGSGQGTALDVSMGGCALESDGTLMPSMILKLKLHVSEYAVPVEVEAAVVRSVRSKIVGLEFARFSLQEKYRLKPYVAELVSAHRKD